MKYFYQKDSEEILTELKTSNSGLSDNEAKSRLEKYGLNKLPEAPRPSAFQIFLNQFKDLIVLILIVAAVISGFTGDHESSIVIIIVLIINAILGTTQTLNAQRSVDSLKQLSVPKVKVIRNGVKQEINSEQLTVGDIIEFEAGDMIVADARIIEASSLQVQESALTGESHAVDKTIETIDDEVVVGDQTNMVFTGSQVTYGKGCAVVTSIGVATEIGKISELLNKATTSKSPLQKSIDEFSKNLSIGIIALCIVVFGLTYISSKDFGGAAMFAIALAVAAVPEALASIITIVESLGSQTLAKENAIMKDINAVETLGSVSIIASDKTGTLTQNKMTVEDVYVNGKLLKPDELSLEDKASKMLMDTMVLTNDSIVNNEKVMLTKGATDELLKKCSHILLDGEVRDITKEDIDQILVQNYNFAEEGLRVLGYAFKVTDKEQLIFDDEYNLTFVGLTSMIDPPRVESKDAVEKAIKAGIKPIMITGDHAITARSIARKIGIFQEGDMVIDGITLENMTDEELARDLEKISVYARVAPEHKIRIVNAWQAKGKIVGMSGDGVNDAPALKQADIGIAMGITGSEVSKDAADMILTDDNFATIVKAITVGRNIFTNIKNAIKYLLTGNTGAIFVVIATTLLAFFDTKYVVPFAAIQLLFINLVTDSLPAIAIGTEPGTDEVLKQAPRDPKEPILTRSTFTAILIEAGLIAIAVFIGYYIGINTGEGYATTFAFLVLCLARLFNGFSCRSDLPLTKIGLFTNKNTIIAFLIGITLVSIIIFIPAIGSIFKVMSLNGIQILTIVGLALAPTIVVQVIKIMKNR